MYDEESNTDNGFNTFNDFSEKSIRLGEYTVVYN